MIISTSLFIVFIFCFFILFGFLFLLFFLSFPFPFLFLQFFFSCPCLFRPFSRLFNFKEKRNIKTIVLLRPRMKLIFVLSLPYFFLIFDFVLVMIEIWQLLVSLESFWFFFLLKHFRILFMLCLLPFAVDLMRDFLFTLIVFITFCI